MYDFAHRRGINISQITNNSLKWLKKQYENNKNTDLDTNKLIFAVIGETGASDDRFEGNRTPDLCHVKASPKMAQIGELTGNAGDLGTPENFSTLGNFKRDKKVKIPGNVQGIKDTILTNYLLSSQDKIDGYVKFCRLSASEATTQGYVSSVLRLPDFKEPIDLANYKVNHKKAITDHQRRGLLKFFGFIQERPPYMTEWNGYPIDLFRKCLADTPHADKRIKSKDEYSLTPEEFRTCRDMLPDSIIREFVTLLAFCGARASQLWKCLKTIGKREVQIFKPTKDVPHAFFSVDVSDIGSGDKLADRYYFPIELIEIVKEFDLGEYKKRENSINDALGRVEFPRPFGARILRKWNYNLMITRTRTEDGYDDRTIESTQADVIQGRVPKTIGASRYAMPSALGETGYGRIVEKLLDYIPIY